jgi:SAM-dependent methyltransferase
VTAVRAGENLQYAGHNLLACPKCHSPVETVGEAFQCTNRGCGYTLRLFGGVVLAKERLQESFFDGTHRKMSATTQLSGTRRMCYTQQTDWIDRQLGNLPPGEGVILDVGCGPRLPYARSDRYFLVGVDASLESVRLNEEVDLRVFGSSSGLPVRDASVDAIVCFYLLHHLVGGGVSEHYRNLEETFREFGRVLKPGGRLYAVEVSPIRPFFEIQRAAWGLVRRLYSRLDMFFWSTRAMREVSLRSLPAGTRLLQQEFHCPFWVMFPFVFAWPHFQLPRCLFPFRAYVYEWCLPTGPSSAAEEA